MSRIYNLFFSWFIIISTYSFGGAFSDSTLELLIKNSQYDSAKKYAIQKIKFIKKTDYDKKLYFLNKQGFSDFRLGNFKMAFKTANEGLLLAKKTKDFNIIFENWQLLAYCSNRLGDFDTAFFYSNKMLQQALHKKSNDKQALAITSLATLFMQNKRYKEALHYNFKACELYKKEKDYYSLAISKYNIGLSYLNLKLFDTSLHYLFESLKVLEEYPKPEVEVIVYGTISDCYLEKKDYFKWKNYQYKAAHLAQKINNPQISAMGFCQLGQFELEHNNFTAAYSYLINANHVLEQKPFPVLQIRIDSLLYITTKKLKLYDESLFWHEKYTNFQQKIYTLKQSESLKKAYVEIETIKKSKLLVEKDQQLVKEKNKITLLFVILIASIVLGVLFFVFKGKLKNYEKRLFVKSKELDKQMELSKVNYYLKINENERALELYQKLLILLDNEKLYLDPDLNIKMIQNYLGTNKKYLYEAIAKCSGTNFKGLINRYRVNEAKNFMKQLVLEKKRFSLNEIFVSSGFNSTTSFFRIFRQQTGLSPKEYISQLKNELKL